MNQQNQNIVSNRASFDDKPIGHKTKFQIPEYAENEQPANIEEIKNPQPIPLNKRLYSKVWKIRKQAFQELLSLTKNDPAAYTPFESSSVEFITFNNIAVQERALKVIVSYISSGKQLSVQPKLMIRTLIQKCLTIEKDEIKGQTEQILYWFMDNKLEETLLNQLNEELLTKNPKILAITFNFITKLLSQYGIKRMKNCQKFEKNLAVLSTTPKVSAKNNMLQLFKQIYRWIGDLCLKNFKIHLDIKDQLVKFSRQYEKKPMQIKRGVKKQTEEGKTKYYNPSVDSEENLEAIDVLLAFTPKWVDEVLQLEKWKDKKQMLDEMIKKTRGVKIIPRQTSHYISLLKRLLSDNNVNILLCGLYITQNLSKGLKKNFSHVSKNIQTLIFSKLKDGKAMIVTQAQNTLKCLLQSISLDQMLEEIRFGLNDKAANMRMQIIKFLINFAPRKDAKVMNCMKGLVDAVCRLTEDGSSDVRDTALDLLCQLKKAHDMKFFGDRLKMLKPSKIQTIQSSHFVENGQQLMDIQKIQQKNIVHLDSMETIPEKVKSLNEQKKIILSNKKMKTEDISIIYSQTQNRKNKPLNNYLKDISNIQQNVRSLAYQNLANKIQPTKDIFHRIRSNALKQNAPKILRSLILIVKNYSQGQPIQRQYIQFLLTHDWKKCKNALTQFLNDSNNKFTATAQEYIKQLNQTILNQPLNPSQLSALYKPFMFEFVNMIPKISNPNKSVKIETAVEILKLIQKLPKIEFQHDIQKVCGDNVDHALNQFYNICKCRILECDQQVNTAFYNLILAFHQKNIGSSLKQMRFFVPAIIKKLPNTNPGIKAILDTFIANDPSTFFIVLVGEVANQQHSQIVLNLIVDYEEIFIRKANLHLYIAPILSAYSNFKFQKENKKRFEILLDRIVEMIGEDQLMIEIHKNKITNSNEYLIHRNISPIAKPQKHTNSKAERVNTYQPWPLEPTPTHIFLLTQTLHSYKEPLSLLVIPIPLSEHQSFSFLQNFETKFLMDYSDLFFKWIYWRTIIDHEDKIPQIMKFAQKVMSAAHFSITDQQVQILLMSLTENMKRFQDKFLKVIIEMIHKLFQIKAELKQITLTFWLHRLQNAIRPPVNQILEIIINCYSQLIPKQMGNLSKIPAVKQNVRFIQYLFNQYDANALHKYGLTKIQNKTVPHQSCQQHVATLMSELGGPENFINVSLSQKQLYRKIIDLPITEMSLQIQKLMEASSQKIETILKFTTVAIQLYFKKQAASANIVYYFHDLCTVFERLVRDVNERIKIDPHLLSLTRVLVYFMVDVDESKSDQRSRLVKTINKILLLLFDYSDPHHILEVLFILLRARFQMKSCNCLSKKAYFLLPKCIARVIKSNPLRERVKQKSNFILTELIDIMKLNKIESNNNIVSSFRNFLQELFNHFKSTTEQNIAKILSNEEVYPPARQLLMNIKLNNNNPQTGANTNFNEEQNLKREINPIIAMGTVGITGPNLQKPS